MNSFLRYDILVLSVREVNLSDGRHVGFVLITLLPSLTEVLHEFCSRKGKILCCFLLKGLFTNLLDLLSENRSVTHNKIPQREKSDGWKLGSANLSILPSCVQGSGKRRAYKSRAYPSDIVSLHFETLSLYRVI